MYTEDVYVFVYLFMDTGLESSLQGSFKATRDIPHRTEQMRETLD